MFRFVSVQTHDVPYQNNNAIKAHYFLLLLEMAFDCFDSIAFECCYVALWFFVIACHCNIYLAVTIGDRYCDGNTNGMQNRKKGYVLFSESMLLEIVTSQAMVELFLKDLDVMSSWQHMAYQEVFWSPTLQNQSLHYL